MNGRLLLALYRLAFGALTLAAIGYQLGMLAADGKLNLVNYFSYFTILSNLFGASLFVVGAARWKAVRSDRMDLLRGAAVVYLAVTFLVFAVLLSGTDVDVANPWVNSVVHEIFPVVVLIDWLVDPPTRRLTDRQGLLWLSFPLAWVVYTMIRGALIDRYPYPFLDPANGGYGTVAVYIVGILVLFLVICPVVVRIGNWARKRHDAAAAAVA